MKHTVTVFRGDGIGPELVDNVLKILEAAKAPLEYEIYNVGEDEWKRNGALIPDEAYASFERTKVLLKSPITTPVGKGFRSLNVTLRGNRKPSRMACVRFGYAETTTDPTLVRLVRMSLLLVCAAAARS